MEQRRTIMASLPHCPLDSGIPALRIDYRISENTRRMMEHGIARAAAGASRISASRTVLNSPGHLLGTTRIGNDPERSVVNAWGHSHDVKNLFIVDGSVWVTSGGVNPTSTIQGGGAVYRGCDEAAAGDVVRVSSSCSSLAGAVITGTLRSILVPRDSVLGKIWLASGESSQ